ncbi:MAG: hypothetical protein P9L99_07655 [Candidatus Lernaella stagnicola]|nr:hypothetical protein [Candidatus Lernaella stagnicola]
MARKKHNAQKKPKQRVKPLEKKTPQQSHNPDDFREKPFCWRVNKSYIDLDGPYGWKNVSTDALLFEVIKCLQDHEARQWKEVLNDHDSKGHKKNHDMPVDKLVTLAQKRLQEINKEEEDSLFSLRVSGKQRLWGIRKSSTLYLLWWDPDHKVYSVKRRHT